MLFKDFYQIVSKQIGILLNICQVAREILIAAVTWNKLLQLPENGGFTVVFVNDGSLVLRFHAMHDPCCKTGLAGTADTGQ